MGIIATNSFQTVTTYQKSDLAGLQNHNAIIGSMANFKFKNFQNEVANLGSTVNFDLPYKFVENVGLVVNFQGIEQRYFPLTVDQAYNVSYASTSQDRIFTLDKDSFWESIGKGAVRTLGASVEKMGCSLAHSALPVMSIVNGQSIPTGAMHYESGPSRFYGDGSTAITTIQQLQQMVTNYQEVGDPGDIQVLLPLNIVPAIVGAETAKFVLRRNESLAQSWELGEYANVKYLTSNLLPVHTSGTVGNAAAASDRQLTVVSTDDPTGANITYITCTTTDTTDASAILAGDMGEFIHVAGKTDVKFVSTYGKVTTSQAAQVRVNANAASSGGTVVIHITPGLCATSCANQNINTNIVAGMKIQMIPTHRCGMLVAGRGLMCAMPQLPSVEPFPSSSKADEKTGVSMRVYWGEVPFQNQRGLVQDLIFGYALPPEYCMRLVIPV